MTNADFEASDGPEHMRLTAENEELRARLHDHAIRFNVSYLKMQCGVCGAFGDGELGTPNHEEGCLLHGYEPPEGEA